MPFEIVRNDITKMDVDVIVNATNQALKMGGGVCGAIFSAAGVSELSAECDRIGHCEPGKVVMTKGYALPAKFIIHSVGPIWRGGNYREAKILESCYREAMELARRHGFKSLAFPLISSGVFGYPKDEALHVAISAIGTYLLQHDLLVYLVVYDRHSFVVSEKLFRNIEKFIDDNYIDAHPDFRSKRGKWNDSSLEDTYPSLNNFENVLYSIRDDEPHRKLEDVLKVKHETFTEQLLRLIDEKGASDVETYKRANVDRKLFSKIRGDKDYKPSKATAIAFCIALRLNMDETLDLMARAGYTLSKASKSDLIITYFIDSGMHNIFEINEMLFQYDQPLLGA
jgi:O-acetyl-ADP-ribose deacetylase (regulator of RNase III)